jgi:tetratricopeptide (TPR) repeat protein
MTLTAVGTARNEALIERYAGDAAAAKRLLRPACDGLRAMGETGFLSGIVGELADAYYQLGLYDEAEEASEESERLTQQGDVASEIHWRRVRAKLLARRGADDAAVRVAREAIEWAETTSQLELRGDAYRDLAEVERLAGRADGAEEALERALDAYERKGLVPMAERTRAELAALRANV